MESDYLKEQKKLDKFLSQNRKTLEPWEAAAIEEWKQLRRKGHDLVAAHLNPPDEILALYKDTISKFYKFLPGFDGDPDEKTEELIDRAKIGWKDCPKKFSLRIRALAIFRSGEITPAGWQGYIAPDRVLNEENSDLVSQEKQLDEEISKLADTKTVVRDALAGAGIKHKKPLSAQQVGRDVLVSRLSEADQKFWKEREKFYRDEFEFNESSDYALLMQVIFEELENQKIMEQRVQNYSASDFIDSARLLELSKAATESSTRLQKALHALGVTRDQRKGEMDEEEGNIAALSLSYDKKMKNLDSRDKAQKLEEEAYLREKFLDGNVFPLEGMPRALHNRIPEFNEIDKLLKEAGIKEDEEKE